MTASQESSSSSAASPQADDSSPPTNWQESITQLSSLLNDDDDIESRATNVKIETACAAILERDDASKAEGDNSGGGEEGHALPASVRGTVTTIYLRALIKLGRYDAVANYCGKHSSSNSKNNNDNNVQEHAYSLYRLRKYEACRTLCASSSDAGGGGSSRGVMHTHAQALYRLGETNEADRVYNRLLASDGEGGDDDVMMDVDEREDALSNALANRSANYTPGSLLGADNKISWLEEEGDLQHLIASYGGDSSQKNDDKEDGTMLQNYDLAYNLATYLLLSSDARDQSQILRAKRLLERAEASALTILESSSAPPSPEGDADDNKEEALRKQRRVQQQRQLAEREAGPIRANLALAKLLLGGESNETEALRAYLTLVTKAAMAKNKGNKGGGGGGGAMMMEANLLATASNNLALLRDGKESLFDVMKRIPAASSLSASEDAAAGSKSSGRGSKDGGKGNGASPASSAAAPLAGATPQQARAALYNRALLFAKMGNVAGCGEASNALRASLLVSYRGDDRRDGERAQNGEAGSGSAQKKSKGRKKKGSAAAAAATTAVAGEGSKARDVPAAKPASEAETIAWSARADWLESEVYRISESKDAAAKSSEETLAGAIAKLDEASKIHKGDDAYGALSFAKSQLLLHKAMVNSQQKRSKGSSKREEALVEAMEALPLSVRSCPGATVAMAHLCGDTKKSEELLSSLGDDVRARLAVAEFQMTKGQYEAAAELLTAIVEGGDDSIEATALLVKALSYTDPSKAEEYVGPLQQAMDDGSEMDGEALESMEIPRFAKKALGATQGAGSSSKVRKMIEQTGGKGRSNLGERNKKKNREAILRKRAKQREAHLSALESQGLYDPNNKNQKQPDPERWIPKSQRSYNRRGRGGRYGNKKSNNGVGAQGGGAGAGMEKDAARLDVAARVAAAKSGVGGVVDAKPSTANIKVTSSGTTRKGKGGRRR